MNDLVLRCNECGADVELTDSLAAPILAKARTEFEAQITKKNSEVAKIKADMAERRATLDAAEAALDETIDMRVNAEKIKLSETATKIARAELKLKMEEQESALEEARAVIQTQESALSKIREKETSLRTAQKALDQEREQFEEAIEGRVKKELEVTRTSIEKTFEKELEARLKEKDAELNEVKQSIETIRLAAEKKANAAARLDLEKRTAEVEELQSALTSATEQVEKSAKSEADLLKQKRTLEGEKRSLELSVQRRVNEELEGAKEVIHEEIAAEFKMKLREKETQLTSMKTEIENLKRKAEQGSQQLQGEAYEQEITSLLSSKFPGDEISRVPKGKFGGDCIHEVYNDQGKLCGTILWELKRRSRWSDGWLTKLKADQHAAKADVAIIVTQSLPSGVETFERLGEIWVAGLDCLIPVAGALRHLLIEIASTRRATEGHQDKASLVYSYVTSVAFKQRVQSMMDTFIAMQTDLNAEQIAYKKVWAKRQSQLDRIIGATTGMHGDLQGIAGQSVPELDGIGFGALGSGS